jgi:hypothetical protein
MLPGAGIDAQVRPRAGGVLVPDRPRDRNAEQNTPLASSADLLLLAGPAGKDAAVRNVGGDVRFSSMGAGRGVYANFNDLFSVGANGNVGIGTNVPAHRLTITGGPAWTTESWKGALELENGAAIAWQANTAGQYFGIGHTNGGFYFFRTTSKPATGGTQSVHDLTIRDDGTVAVRTLEIMGADLAESFEVGSAAAKPGLVVSIDPRHEGGLVVSDRPYDRRVAGVISGAGGIEPGVVMGRSIPFSRDAHPVALSGRVYCWVDTSNGPVQAGDLLTTSSVPGHAMKVTDHAKAQGAIIGKAMGELASGSELVLVLVALQ